MKALAKYPLFNFVFLAYAISWIIWLPLYLPHFGIKGFPVLPYHHALGAYGPFLAAFIVSFFSDGKEGIKSLLERLIKWKVAFKWYLIAFLSPFLLFFVAWLLVYFSKGQSLNSREIGITAEFPEFGFIAFLLYNIFTFGFGEETGWRGFLLPKMQTEYSALVTSLLLTFIWAGWHIPLFFYRPGYTSMDVFGIVGWVLSLATGSILLTWLYNGAKESILIVSIFHATIDVAFTSIAAQGEIVQYMGMLITFWGIGVAFLIWPRNQVDTNKEKTISQL